VARTGVRQLTSSTAGLIAIAATLAAGGCGGDPAPPSAAAAAAAPSPAQLGVVTLQAQIGGDRVRSAGVVIDPARGLVATTAHSLWGAKSLKVSTAIAVLYGRIVARDTCDDLALVETQPSLPGLAAPRAVATKPEEGEPVAVPRRAWAARLGGPGPIAVVRSTLVPATAPALAALPRAPGRLALGGQHASELSGAPVLDADGNVIALLRVVAAPGARATAVVMPWATIAERLGELRPGPSTIYVGWRARNRCAAPLHALAARLHPGFQPPDARLNVPVPATRLPGTQELDRR
jgi:S1-C subfamily serine protease